MRFETVLELYTLRAKCALDEQYRKRIDDIREDVRVAVRKLREH